jgi:hypothetical protein
MQIINKDGKNRPDEKKNQYETSSILLTTYKRPGEQRKRGDEKLFFFYLPSTMNKKGEKAKCV